MAPTPPIVVSTDDFTPLTLQRSDTEKTWEDVVREVSQARMQREPVDETGRSDTDFRLTKVDDLRNCISDGEGRENLDRYLPSKIVKETRSKYQDTVRRGVDDDGSTVLEGGLKLLDNDLGSKSDAWKFNRCELLWDLGRDEEIRSLLASETGQTRAQERSSQASNATYDPRRSLSLHVNTDAQYEEMVRLKHQNLDLALRAEAWDQVKIATTEIEGLDKSYFDFKQPMGRFEKIRQLLNLGYLEELEAGKYKDKPAEVQKHLRKALETYNHGCYATDLFHKHFDDPNSEVYDYDHIDCANLFFSAARVCIYFHDRQFRDESNQLLTPKGTQLKPELTEPEWKSQALHFLEQGRSRALLDSITRGEEFVPSFQKDLLLDNFIFAAKGIVRIKKRDSLFPASAPQSRSTSPMDVTPKLFKFSDLKDKSPLSIPIKAIRKLNNPNKRTIVPDNASKAPAEVQSEPSSPSTLKSKNQAFTEDHMKSLAFQMRWRKVLLYLFSDINPTFNAAAAALPETGIKMFQDMSKSIPSDTLVLEYGLPSSAPNGLVTLLINSQGVSKAIWKETNVREIKATIKTLRHKMAQDIGRSYRDAPGSPVSPESARSMRSLPDFDGKTVEELRQSLYSRLIAPIVSHLAAQETKRLIIIPSGELAHVPWGMLLPNLPFSVVPSLSIWHQLHKKSSKIAVAEPKISVFSNKPKNAAGGLRNIPFSRIEALYLSTLHSQLPELADEYDRKKFEEFSKSMRSSKDKQILHLCAHSSFDDRDPEKSSVQLFNEAWSITDWREFAIKADIVIFSSCLSAISQAYDSGSTFGFAHTLLASGTRAFVGSLWPVEDEPTLLLMMLFYQELRRPLAPAEALHRAQTRLRELSQQGLTELVIDLRTMINKLGATAREYINAPNFWITNLEQYDVGKLRDPRCWAAFILTGYGFRAVYPQIDVA